MRNAAFVLVTVAIAVSLFSVVPAMGALHVGVLSIPCFGHVNPIRAVAAQLLLDGNTVTMLTETPKRAWCEKFRATPTERAPSRDAFYYGTEATSAPISNATSFQCYLMPESGRYTQTLWVNMSMADDIASSFDALFAEMFDYHVEQIGTFIASIQAVEKQFGKLSVILTDYATLPGHTAGKVMSIPVVSLYPLTLNLPLGSATSMPMMGTGLGKHSALTIFNRAYIWAMRAIVAILTEKVVLPLKVNPDLVNATGAAVGTDFFHAGASELGLMNTLVFVPAMPLFDVAIPVCPNVISVGSTSSMSLELLHERISDPDQLRTAYYDSVSLDVRGGTFGPTSAADTVSLVKTLQKELESDLFAFLNDHPSCKDFGAVYVNFGTLSVVSDLTFARVFRSLLDSRFCIVWKVSERERFDNVSAVLAGMGRDVRSRFYIVSSGAGVGGGGFRSPPAIMSHPNTKVFISHCGDTSVLEAIEAQLPVAGIPMFADQGDVCQRVSESRIGVYVGQKHSFTSSHLSSVLDELGNPGPRRTEALQALARVRHGSRHLGGAGTAARIIQEHFSNGLLSTDTSAPPFFPRTSSSRDITYFFHPFACNHLSPRYLSALDHTGVNRLVGAEPKAVPYLRPSSIVYLHNLDVAFFAVSWCLGVLFTIKFIVLKVCGMRGVAANPPEKADPQSEVGIAHFTATVHPTPPRSTRRVKVTSVD